MRVDFRDRSDKQRALNIAHRHDRVLIDGVDVTSACFMADDQEGIVGIYLRDETGHFYEHGGIAAQEIRRGVVKFYRGRVDGPYFG